MSGHMLGLLLLCSALHVRALEKVQGGMLQHLHRVPPEMLHSNPRTAAETAVQPLRNVSGIPVGAMWRGIGGSLLGSCLAALKSIYPPLGPLPSPPAEYFVFSNAARPLVSIAPWPTGSAQINSLTSSCSSAARC
eukprot:364577-Chlamydomonas_euryale.AAC.31